MSEEKTVSVTFSGVNLTINLSQEQLAQIVAAQGGAVAKPSKTRTDSLQHKIREEIKKHIADKRAGFVLRGGHAAYMMIERFPTLSQDSVCGACSGALKTLVERGYLTKQNKQTYVVTGKEETLV